MEKHLGLLHRRDCILLLVDVQKSMLDLCVEPVRVQENSAALIEAAGVFGIPVLFSAHNSDKLGPVLPELTGMIERPSVLGKLAFNCFDEAQISAAFLEKGRKTLLLAGIETHVCIFHTALGALRNDYRVHVAADAVSSRGTTDKQVALQRLDRAGADVTSTEMIIFELLKRAGTDEFRKLLPLLKKLPV